MRCSSRPPKVSMTQHWNNVARELEMEPTHLFTHLAEVAREEEALWKIAEYGSGVQLIEDTIILKKTNGKKMFLNEMKEI